MRLVSFASNAKNAAAAASAASYCRRPNNCLTSFGSENSTPLFNVVRGRNLAFSSLQHVADPYNSESPQSSKATMVNIARIQPLSTAATSTHPRMAIVESSLIPDDVSGRREINDNNNHAAISTAATKKIETTELISMTLEERTNYILHQIPPGYMDNESIQHARRDMSYWRSKKSEYGAVMAERLLHRIAAERHAREKSDEQNTRNNVTAFVTTSMYHICIDAWAKSGAADAASRAESLLCKMEEEYTKSLEGKKSSPLSSLSSNMDSIVARPNTPCYNAVLHAWSQSKSQDATHRAEQILLKMEEQSATKNTRNHNDTGKESLNIIMPDTNTYNILINTYANRRGQYSSAKRAEDLLLHMSQLHRDGNDMVRPNTISFNTVLKAWSNIGTEGGARRAEEILHVMMKLHHEGHENVKPTAWSFSTVIDAYARLGSVEAVERAEGVLTWMEEEFYNDDDAGKNVTNDYNGVYVDDNDDDERGGIRRKSKAVDGGATSPYNALLNAWAKSNFPEAGERAEAVLNRMKKIHLQKGRASIQPDVISYTSCIEAYARNGGENGVKKADELLRQMIEDCRSGRSTVWPNVVTFNCVMAAWLRIKKANAARKVDDVFRLMLDVAEETGSYELRPDGSAYELCIEAWTKNEEAGSAKRATEFLEQMEEAYASGNSAVKPSAFSYNKVIGAWLRSGERGAESRAHDVLQRMQKQYEQGNTEARPDFISYNSVLTCFWKVGTRETAERAQALLERMEKLYQSGHDAVQPDTLSYATVINTWGKSRDRRAAKIAVRLLDEMERLGQDENRVVQLETFAFRSVLGVLSSSKESWVGGKACEILNRMFELYETGNEKVKPCSTCILWCIQALVNSSGRNGSPLRAQEMLVELVKRYREGGIDILPYRVAFNAVIAAWSKSDDERAVGHSEKLLILMKQLHQEGHDGLEPDAFTYSSIINVLAGSTKDGAAQQAHDILEMMESENRRGNHKIKADRIVYNTVIKAWANSTAAGCGKVQKARIILDMMKNRVKNGDSSVEPDKFTYNSLLTAAARTNGTAEDKREALNFAFDLFDEIKQSNHFQPDHITYGTMVKACKRLMEAGEDRTKKIKSIFEECSSGGLVGKMVMREARYALSNVEQKEVFGSHSKSYSPSSHFRTLPQKWTCNVKER